MSWSNEAPSFLRRTQEDRIAAAFAALFETKSLYQSVKVDLDALVIESRDHPMPVVSEGLSAEDGAAASRENTERCARETFADRWDVDGTEDSRVPRHSIMEGHLRVVLPPIKTGCGRCKSPEAFRSVRCEDMCLKGYPAAPERPRTPETYQLFVCTYQCQRCTGPHEGFLVRRAGPRLTLCGRAPLGLIDVPVSVPAPVRKHLANAEVAANAGQPLAALFLPRTVIEQVARAETGVCARPAEKTLDAYMDRLPVDFKNRFPSLKQIYEDLSDGMHEAREDVELFRRSHAAVLKHFEARKVFDL